MKLLAGLVAAGLIACGPRAAPPAMTGAAPEVHDMARFAVFVARMHQRIHPGWGGGYLEPMADDERARVTALGVDVDLGIGADGAVTSLVVSRSSGVARFDDVAADAVRKAEPFAAPSPEIRSADGVTYLRWTFYGNERACGTAGVEPFVLPAAPARGILPPSPPRQRAIPDSMAR